MLFKILTPLILLFAAISRTPSANGPSITEDPIQALLVSTWVMVASLATSLASAAASARSQYLQGKAAERNAEYNNQIAEQNADEEKSARAIEATSERNQSRRRLSSMRARYAKTGLMMAGTPDLMVQSQAESDEFNILSRDRASKIRQQNILSQGKLGIIQAADTARAGQWGAGTTLAGALADTGVAAANYKLQMGDKTKVGK